MEDLANFVGRSTPVTEYPHSVVELAQTDKRPKAAHSKSVLVRLVEMDNPSRHCSAEQDVMLQFSRVSRQRLGVDSSAHQNGTSMGRTMSPIPPSHAGLLIQEAARRGCELDVVKGEQQSERGAFLMSVLQG